MRIMSEGKKIQKRLESIVLNIKQSEKVLLFGTRGLAKILWCYFRDVCGIENISGFVVSRKDENPDKLFDVPVYEVNDIEDKNTLILLGITEKHIPSVKKILAEHKKENIILFDEQVIEEISKEYIVFLLEKYKVFNNGSTIQMKNIRTINFLQNCRDYYCLLLELGDFILPSVYGFYDLVNEGLYEYKDCYLNEGDYVIDAGADRGLFSCFAATKIGDKGKVFAFEPTPESCIVLEKQSSINNGIIVPNQVAVDESGGMKKLLIGGETNTSNKLGTDIEGENAIDINTITIDEFVQKNNIEHIDFIKADIEGAERRMLKGAVKTLKTMAPRLAICTYHLPDDKYVLEKIIKDANPRYTVVHKWLKLYAWVDENK